jgi:hypothetical protein
MPSIFDDPLNEKEIIYLSLFKNWLKARSKNYTMFDDHIILGLSSVRNLLKTRIENKFNEMKLDFDSIFEKSKQSNRIGWQEIKSIIENDLKKINTEREKEIEKINSYDDNKILSIYTASFDLLLTDKELEAYDDYRISIKQFYQSYFSPNDRNEKNYFKSMFHIIRDYGKAVAIDNNEFKRLSFPLYYINPKPFLKAMNGLKNGCFDDEKNKTFISIFLANLKRNEEGLNIFDKEFMKPNRQKGGQSRVFETEFIITKMYKNIVSTGSPIPQNESTSLDKSKAKWVYDLHKKLIKIKK